MLIFKKHTAQNFCFFLSCPDSENLDDEEKSDVKEEILALLRQPLLLIVIVKLYFQKYFHVLYLTN